MMDCISLVKEYQRAARAGRLTHEENMRIQGILQERVSNGTAHQRLVPFLNRLTKNVKASGSVVCGDRYISPGELKDLYLLYEHIIDSAKTPESASYLILSLQSKSAVRGEVKYEFQGKLLSEDTEVENGPDQCGHINTRYYHYRTYGVERHYHLRRPLVERARRQLVDILNHLPTRSEAKSAIYRALDESREFERNGGFGVEIAHEEIRSFHGVDYVGDHGYW